MQVHDKGLIYYNRGDCRVNVDAWRVLRDFFSSTVITAVKAMVNVNFPTKGS